MFQPRSSAVFGNQLDVQSINCTNKDSPIVVVSGSDIILIIGEPVREIRFAQQKDDSANALINFAASSLSIVDSSAYTAGGDKKAIKVASCTLDNLDLLECKYVVEQS